MAQQFDIVGNLLLKVDGAEAGLNKLKNSLSQLKMPANLDSNLKKSFSNLDGLLAKYKAQLKDGFNTKGDVTSFAKTGKQIEAEYDRIAATVSKLTGKDISFKVDLTTIQNLEKEIEKVVSLKEKLSQDIKGGLGLNDYLKAMQASDVGRRGTKVFDASNMLQTSLGRGDIEKAKTDVEGLISELNHMSDARKKALEDRTGIAFNQIITELRTKITDADQAMNKFGNDIKTTSDNIAQIRADGVDKVTTALNEVVSGTDKAQSGFKQLNGTAQETANSMLSMTKQVEQLQQSTQYFFSLRNMINLLKRGIDEAVQSVKDLDKAMTETAVVTDYKVSDLWGMLPEYTKVANQLGATTQGAYETMTLYYQQGLEQQQAFELGAETMKMARIAGLDYAETTDMMTAALRGFNMELNETSAKRVNDVYSELAAITASDTEELGTAMQRTASIAASAGASFEGTTAFLAQAIETTREPAENIGTAMKTIVARFQEMKKNPLEISEVEGEEVDYNKIDAALKTIGVDLKDTNGQFREFDQVMLDISARWDSLSQAQQRYIATTAAGSRQQSRFIAMVSNYDRTMQLMEAANNSAGASDEQFGKTMDSLESKLNQLHNAWQRFTMGIANNGMIKLAVDGLTGFLNVTNKIIDTLSLGSGAIKSFLSVFAAFTGLKMAGRAANSLIGGLGGLVDPQSTVKEGLTTGLFGQGKNNAQAKAITTPIVSSLNKISQQIAQIKNGKIGDDSNQSGQKRNTSKQEYLDIKKQFDKLSSKEGFKIGEASSLFGQLDAKHQQAMFNNSPGTKAAMKKASMAWFDSRGLSKELTNEGKQYINSIYKGMEQGQIPVDKGEELIGRPDLWGEHFATDAAKAFSDQYVKNLTVNESDLRAASEAMIEQFSTEQIAAMSKEDYDKQADKLAQEFAAKRIGKEHGETKGTVTNMGRFANDIGAVADKFTQAGYGITTFGNALSQLDGPLGVVGSGIAALGGAISTIGASISGATGIIGLFTEGLVAANGTVLVAGSTIAAVAAPLAALAAGFLLVRHHIKKVKEAGEEVTKTFNDVNKETQDNVTKLKSYQGEFASLSQGVDINGNNVSLDDSQYQRYLEIVDEIATINPAIVKGYNAQGHAILDNNIALEETLRLQEQLQKEAYKTYLSEGSLQTLINARNVNTDYGKAVRNLYGGKLGDSGKAGKVSPLTNDVQSLADQLNLSGDRKATEHILEKYGIESLDALIKGEEQAVKKFVDYQDQIQADLSNFGVDLSEGVIKGFQTLGENTEAFEAAIKPVYDNLLALVSNSSAYKDLAPEMRSALAEGLKGIASQNLGAKEMQQAANYLMLEFQDAFDKAQPYLDQADEALNTFTQDLDEAAYNNSASNIAENLRELARQAEAVGQVEIAEWYENQASRIESAITNATYSIADGVDTLTDNIAKAKANFDSLAEGIDDYYTLTDKARGLVDTALEDKNTGGNGSKTFWKTYQGLASEEAFNRHDLNEAIADMEQFQKYFAEGADGAAAFGQKLVDSQNDAFKFTEANGEETTKHVSDFFKLAEDGTMQITDEFKNLSDEQYSQLAAAFKLSDDGFTAILNNLRQWGDINFSDPGLIRKALATDARSVTTNKKVAVEGEDEKVNRLYYGESTLRAETPELTKDKREDLVNDLKVQGSIELPSGAENLIKAGTGEKEDGSLLKQFIADTKGTGNQMQNVMASLIKSGEYNKEDLEKIHQSIVDQNLLAGAKDADKSFEDIYSAAELQVTDPATEAANEHLSNISSTVSTIAGIVAAGKVGEGYLPDVAKQSGNLYNELVGEKGKADTWAQKFANGKDENGYAITDKAKYNEIFAKLDEYKTANDNYINELKEGKAAAEERGASVAELEAFDNEIEAATHNAEIIDFCFQGAKDSAEKVETDFYNAGQTVFQGLADIRNNPNLTPDQQKSETADVLIGFAKQLEGLNFSPEAIAGVFKENFGIELELKGNEFATDVGEQINEQIKGLDQAEINAVLNIASIKMATAARGKNNTPSAIRRVGTMARGSKKHGYTIDGEPTLTGELGPELVWEPRQNAAYMVGEHGPQFANISKNAVVWNAEQTKRIKKNSKGASPLGTGARGIRSFGTMAGGNVGGTKIPGTLEVDANANILEVIPPTPEPEIPVKAKLEVEGASGGNIFSKLFGGGEQGPSISVAANVTSINTGEQLQTIPVVGNITKLNTESTIDDVKASAVVTQVTKGAQVAGEPITVKATATTTSVKNEAPAQKTKVEGQTMKVGADTSAAQSKINQLIKLFNKTYTLKYKASGPSSISVPISANFTGSWQKTVTINKSGAKGINNRINTSSLPSFGSAAAGRYGTIGPKNKGGLTLTGEKGFEIAWLPNENRSMVLGVDGPQMLKLPSDAVIYNHEQSKKILKQKGISAGSAPNGTNTAKGSNILKYVNVSTNSSSSSSSSSSGKKKSDDKSKKNTEKADKVITKIGKVSVWWENIARQTEATQRLMDRNAKAFEKYIKDIRATLHKTGVSQKEGGGGGDDYIASINKYKQYNEQQVAQANVDLNKLDKGSSKTSISYKKGKKTKEEKVKLSNYIKYNAELDTYEIDQAAINKTAGKNKNKAKAIKEEAEKKINEKLSKRNSAQDNIEKAEEALEKFGEELYNAFFAWENELTKIWNITQKIAETENHINRAKSYTELLDAKVGSGIQKAVDVSQASIDAFSTQVQSQATNLQNNIEALGDERDDLRRTMSLADEKATLTAIQGYLKTNKGPDGRTLNETDRKGYLNWGEKLEKQINTLDDAWKYLTVTQRADGTLDTKFNTTSFEADRQAGLINDEKAKTIQDYVKSMVEKSEAINNRIDTITSSTTEFYNELETLKDEWAGYADQLWDISDAEQKKELDNFKKLSDSLDNAFKNLLDEVKRKLDERRQQEDNIKTERDISQKQQRLAMLQADTSGGHQVEIAQLQQEIANAQQDYQRSLEDQMLDKLQQQADQAAQQREQQIELQSATIDAINNASLVNQWLADPKNPDNKQAMYEAFMAANEADTKPDAIKEQLERQFEELYLGIITNKDKQDALYSSDQAQNQIINQIEDGTIKIANWSGQESGILDSIKAGIDGLNSSGSSVSLSNGGKVTEGGTKAISTPSTSNPAPAPAAKPNPLNAYKAKVQAAQSNKKMGADEFKSVVAHAKAAGISMTQMGKDLAKTEGLTWKQVVKAAKKAGYSKATVTSWWGNVSKKSKNAIKDWSKYAAGGLADYTGPAWLDGTPSKPELVLNAKDTQNFLALRDVLSKAIGSTNSITNSYGGDNIFEINVNVDKIEKDYDVDRVIEKVKKEITKGAGYRNVTQVRNFR